jgi:hypothetical protein
VAVSLAISETPALRHQAPVLARLAKDSDLIAELLESDYGRLVGYVKTLPRLTARGRSVDDILCDERGRGTYVGEVTAWAKSYLSPSLTRDEKTLVRLRAFLGTKLPA